MSIKKGIYSRRGKNLLVIKNQELCESKLDYKGAPYQEKTVRYDIEDMKGNRIVSFCEGNILDQSRTIERKVETDIRYYKNFFALCCHTEETDLTMGIIDSMSDHTSLYTYKGLLLEANLIRWKEDKEAIEMYNNRAYLFDKDREELEREK